MKSGRIRAIGITSTFFMAKGLTFDSVLLPRLTAKAYYYINRERMKRMMFVGVARATQWVYLCTVEWQEFQEMDVLKEAANQGHLTMQGSGEWRAGAYRGGEGERARGKDWRGDCLKSRRRKMNIWYCDSDKMTSALIVPP